MKTLSLNKAEYDFTRFSAIYTAVGGKDIRRVNSSECGDGSLPGFQVFQCSRTRSFRVVFTRRNCCFRETATIYTVLSLSEEAVKRFLTAKLQFKMLRAYLKYILKIHQYLLAYKPVEDSIQVQKIINSISRSRLLNFFSIQLMKFLSQKQKLYMSIYVMIFVRSGHRNEMLKFHTQPQKS